MLVLLSRLPDVFQGVVARARDSSRPIADVELETLGVTHAEVGAYLDEIGPEGCFQTDGKTVKFKIITKVPGEKTADRNDPYGETGFSSIKWYYGALILRPERIAISVAKGSTHVPSAKRAPMMLPTPPCSTAAVTARSRQKSSRAWARS